MKTPKQTPKQATKGRALTEAQLKSVNGAMTREERLQWHLDRQEAFRNGEEWRIPRPGGGSGASTPWKSG